MERRKLYLIFKKLASSGEFMFIVSVGIAVAFILGTYFTAPFNPYAYVEWSARDGTTNKYLVLAHLFGLSIVIFLVSRILWHGYRFLYDYLLKNQRRTN